MWIESFLAYLRLERNYSEKTVVSYGIDLREFEGYFKKADAENTEFLSRMVERERRSALHSLFYSLDINWVNSMNAFDLHKKKAFLTKETLF